MRISLTALSSFRGPFLNTYAYANNNPLTYTDPEGTFGLIGAGIGVGVEIAVQLASNGGRVECIDIADVIIAGVVGAVAPGFLTSGRAVLRSGRAIRALRAQSAMTANRRAKIASRIANNVDSAAVAVSTQAVFQGGKAVAKSELNGPEPDKCEKRCGE